LTLFLLIILFTLSLTVILSKKLITGIIALSAFSLISALLFYVLRAPDVAITEAAVGAGVSTVIYLWTIKGTKEDDSHE